MASDRSKLRNCFARSGRGARNECNREAFADNDVYRVRDERVRADDFSDYDYCPLDPYDKADFPCTNRPRKTSAHEYHADFLAHAPRMAPITRKPTRT